jgi:fatty-acid desaturase
MATQLPLAAILFAVGGLPFVVWGICVRVTTSLIGHWFVGWLAHNFGELRWQLKDASVQGYNVPGLGLITMGESWHNNHHAFPESARLGHNWSQPDPGWWFVCLLQKLGLATRITLPEDHLEPIVVESASDTLPASVESMSRRFQQ